MRVGALRVLAFAAVLGASCSDSGGTANCESGTVRCYENAVEVCGVDGQWVVDHVCEGACELGTCVSACGNGAIDDGEQCDGADVGGQTCATRGFADGVLACAADCSFDTSACTGGGCGDGTCATGETASSCCDDCGACGDGTCCPGTENAAVCCEDCGGCTTCPNGTCDPGETDCPGSCPQDCDPGCGDGCCSGAESCSTCATDCTGSCAPGSTEACGFCGTRTCLACGWGSCDDEGVCASGTHDARPCTCGGSESRTCDSSCSWGAWSGCAPGECVPGGSDSRACTCGGTETRTCSAVCIWGAWSGCPAGACTPATTESRACACGGTETRTCSSSCSWGGWSGCPTGACTPAATESRSCACGGTESRTCDSSCSWGAWSGCVAGACTAGATESRACTCGGTETRTCSTDCTWGGWSGCSAGAVTDDFADGTVSPWTVVAGDVTVTGGRLRIVRTASRWGEATQGLGGTWTGGWDVQVTMEMLTTQSVVSLCLDRTGATVHRYCVTLNTKTENGSQQGAHLFYDTFMDNTGMAAGAELIEYAFNPGVGSSHTLRVTRSATGRFELFVDGMSRGTATDTRLAQFDRITLYGMQDSSSGHGGYVDDVAISCSGGMTCPVSDDFADGTVAPWIIVAGDVTVSSGRLRVVRTGTRWGEANQNLGSVWTGAWEVQAVMQLLTTQSVVSLCMDRTGTTLHRYCATLNTKTENGSQRGAHFFYDTFMDNVGTPAGLELIEYSFDPGTASSHTLRVTRSASGQFELFVDGASRGTATDTRLTEFDRVTLYGMQDSSSGHGGFFDDISICH